MKILVTGATGVLGSALCNVLKDEYKIVGIARHVQSPMPKVQCPKSIVADITDKMAIKKVVTEIDPEIIIHSAAYTDVDGCELEPDRARAVNAGGTGNVARAAAEIGAALIYISTDHVFDGKSSAPYVETDAPSPVNIYGRTKLEGERLVQKLVSRHIIIRTSWPFGKKGKGFIDTVLARARREKSLNIANDKFSTPTYNLDLAQAIRKIIGIATSHQPPANLFGIYHITNEGSCSWYEYAREILKCADIKNVKISPIKFKELNLPAKRPIYSVLDKSKYNKLTGAPMRDWQDALKEYINLCYKN